MLQTHALLWTLTQETQTEAKGGFTALLRGPVPLCAKEGQTFSPSQNFPTGFKNGVLLLSFNLTAPPLLSRDILSVRPHTMSHLD